MSSVYRLARLHIGFSILVAPVLALLLLTESGSDNGAESSIWPYAVVSAIYMAMAAMKVPSPVYRVMYMLGLSVRSSSCLFATVGLFTLSVAIGKISGIGYVLGPLAIVLALCFFLYAVVVVLFVEETSLKRDGISDGDI